MRYSYICISNPTDHEARKITTQDLLLSQHLRTEKNIKQIVIANALDINGCTYSKIENGKQGFTFNFLEKVAEFYNLSSTEIILYSEINYLETARLSDFEKSVVNVIHTLKNYNKSLDLTERLVNTAHGLLANKQPDSQNLNKVYTEAMQYFKRENDLTELSKMESDLTELSKTES